jgi:hypothetical protein
MLYLFIFMFTIFVSYVGFIYFVYGIQKSISESYYTLPKNLKFLFTLFCVGFSVPAMILGNSLLMFIAGAGICFVGVATDFKWKFMETIHISAAVAGITASQLAIFFQYGLPWINVAFIVTFIALLAFKVKNSTWWVEIAAFLAICLTFALSL